MSSLSSAIVRFAGLVDRWHWAPLVVASPALLFPSPANAVALLILPLVWTAGLAAKRAPFPRTPLNVALLLICVMVLVSEWATFDLSLSAPKITGVALGVAAFFAIVRAGKTARGWWLSLLAFLGLGAGFAVFGLMGTRWGIKIAALTPLTQGLAIRITGIPGIEEGLNPNQLGGTLLWVLPALLVLCGLVVSDQHAVLSRSGWRVRGTVKVGIATVTLLVLAVFLLTESRSAWAGFVLVLPVMVLALLWRRWKRAALALVAVGIAGLGMLLWLGFPVEFVATLSSQAPESSALSLASLRNRLDFWSGAIQAIQDFPLTGMGMNTFRRVAGVLYPGILEAVSSDVAHAHNEFLQVGLDLGLPGLAAFAALYVGAFSMLLQIVRWRPGNANARRKALGLPAAGARVHRPEAPYRIPSPRWYGSAGRWPLGWEPACWPTCSSG